MIDVFLHIPKTGGMSLRTATRWIYGWRGVYTTPKRVVDPEEIANAIPDPTAVHHVRGHIAYGLHEHVSVPCRYFTMLRDPISRILSLYYYVKRNWPNSNVARMSLEDYIESNHKTYYNNAQVRQLAGPPFKEGRQGSILKRAKDNIEKDNVVFGITESFDESLVFMKRKMDWDRDPIYIRSNTSSERPQKKDVSKDIIKKISEQNSLDIKIYKHAKKVIMKKIEKESNFDKDIKSFKSKIGSISIFGSQLMRAYRFVRGIIE